MLMVYQLKLIGLICVENVFPKEGHWEWYCKYIEQNCFNLFLTLQFTNTGHLAVVALSDCHKIMAAR